MRNLAKWDKGIRAFVVAPLAIVLAIVVGPSSIAGIILWAIAGIMLVTAAVGFCPLYSLLGINTCAVKSGSSSRPATHS